MYQARVPVAHTLMEGVKPKEPFLLPYDGKIESAMQLAAVYGHLSTRSRMAHGRPSLMRVEELAYGGGNQVGHVFRRLSCVVLMLVSLIVLIACRHSDSSPPPASSSTSTQASTGSSTPSTPRTIESSTIRTTPQRSPATTRARVPPPVPATTTAAPLEGCSITVTCSQETTPSTTSPPTDTESATGGEPDR